ncbi:MAG: signal peptidase I, partial [Pseudomonadota bacterium]
DCEKERKIETLPNGRSYPVLSISQQGSDNTGIFTVPEGHYFFVGDNRDNSLDSRFARGTGGVGFVPYENLIGRADRIVFSSAGRSMLFFWTWRSDRYFKKIE